MNNIQTIEDDSWKVTLRSEILTALTGSAADRIHAMTQIGMYYQCAAPASLYKYYGDSPRCLESVKANKMWYSAPYNFNDVFDCEITIDENAIFQDALKRVPTNVPVRPGSQVWKTVREAIKREMRTFRGEFEKLRKTTGVSCLSESDDSLLMWAHYANNHRGMCVEYDMESISQQLTFTPIPVIYSDERVRFHILREDPSGNDAVRLLINSVTTKSRDWSYENEWRIIRDKGACGDRWDSDKQGALLDMISPISITLGCAATPEFEKAVREYCESNRVNLFKMEKDSDIYRLNRKSIVEFQTMP